MLEFEPFATDEDFLLQEGEYPFYVKEAQKHLGQSGNLSIKIMVVVVDAQQKEWILFDYLTPKFAKKLKHFCDGTGLSDVYQSGRIEPQMCIGRKGKCKIARESGDERYDAKNVIRDYVKNPTPIAAPVSDDGLNGDIPF